MLASPNRSYIWFYVTYAAKLDVGCDRVAKKGRIAPFFDQLFP